MIEDNFRGESGAEWAGGGGGGGGATYVFRVRYVCLCENPTGVQMSREYSSIHLLNPLKGFEVKCFMKESFLSFFDQRDIVSHVSICFLYRWRRVSSSPC